ncbi:MAG TPA: 50S ribosomal protein L10 [Deltaproteobacteria bacterium]|nr:50S ribosomal protein L10 [Deltaproteobacteria bacterium]
MDRATKEALVKDFHEKFRCAEATFVADYRGMKVEAMTELRRRLREKSVEFRIVRNTLARRALKGTRVEAVEEHFAGPTAVAFTTADPAAAAKALVGFAKDQPELRLKAATLQEKVLTVEEIKSLAELPSREELLAKLVGVMAAVPRSFVTVLAGVPRSLVTVLGAVRDGKEQQG